MLRDPGVGWSNGSWGARGPRRPWGAWRSPFSRDAHSSVLARAPWGALWTCNRTSGMGGYAGSREALGGCQRQDKAAWGSGDEGSGGHRSGQFLALTSLALY